MIWATLHSAAAAATTRADVLALASHGDAAAATYETLLTVLGIALAAEAEPPRGWERPARTLCDLRTPTVIAALGADPADALRLRALTLLDLPDVSRVESLATMQEVIAAAIEVGAPRYNGGDVRGCCAKYWATAQTLLAAPAARGFPGHARALGLLRAAAELDAPPVPTTERGVDDFAWRLRHAFDAVLALGG